jgi:hypothetical protein
MISELSQYFYKLAKEYFVFSYEILDNLKTLKEKNEYLSKFFQVIGKGQSGRKVFLKNSKKAIKLAYNKNGIKQNKIESEILQNNNSIWLPKFYQSVIDYSWIEVELVRPLKGSYEIEELINVNGQDFISLMENLGNQKNLSLFDLINQEIDMLRKNLERLSHNKFETEFTKQNLKQFINKHESYLSNKYLKELQKLISATHLDPWEFAFVFNLGKSASGHLVLLDLGKIL